mmetsp:Transcript_15869/g.54194  ORF Transcript_15869/g.54194 Transcript_15869/m.54194 type:complete len:394 (-) Transcript_15869:2856-4037(-)
MDTLRFSPPESPRTKLSPIRLCATRHRPRSETICITRWRRFRLSTEGGRRSLAWNHRYSHTVEVPGRTSSWETKPATRESCLCPTSCPCSQMSPLVRTLALVRVRPASISTRVVLPAPLGPMMANTPCESSHCAHASPLTPRSTSFHRPACVRTLKHSPSHIREDSGGAEAELGAGLASESGACSVTPSEVDASSGMCTESTPSLSPRPACSSRRSAEKSYPLPPRRNVLRDHATVAYRCAIARPQSVTAQNAPLTASIPTRSGYSLIGLNPSSCRMRFPWMRSGGRSPKVKRKCTFVSWNSLTTSASYAKWPNEKLVIHSTMPSGFSVKRRNPPKSSTVTRHRLPTTCATLTEGAMAPMAMHISDAAQLKSTRVTMKTTRHLPQPGCRSISQ